MEISEEDQAVDETGDARFGRPITAGTYDVEVVEVEEGVTGKGANKVKIVLATLNASPDQAPEGQVKVDYHCVFGQFSIRNMIEVLDPTKLGKKKANLDTASYVGLRCKAALKWDKARVKEGATPEQIADGTGLYKAKAAVIKLVGPAVRATASANSKDEF